MNLDTTIYLQIPWRQRRLQEHSRKLRADPSRREQLFQKHLLSGVERHWGCSQLLCSKFN